MPTCLDGISLPVVLTDGVRATGARWGLVGAGMALIGTCYGFARFAYGLFAPEFQQTFAISSTLSGVIGSGSYVGYCIAIVASLVLTERLGARRVAVAAGIVATVGITIVAIAPSALVLAGGVLIAGSSTGIASPPLAAAVTRWVRASSQDRAQTVVNAGTGIGVLISGPIALVLVEQWRWVWATFAILAAAVTWWVHHAVPPTDSEPGSDSGQPGWVPGTAALVAGSFLMGFSSIAVWTFGRDLVTTEGDASAVVSALMWTTLGVAGLVGALGGDLVTRAGLTRSWIAMMLAMSAATALLATAPASMSTIFAAAAVFGAAYISLTGLALLWSTRIYPERTSFGVGLCFFMIAAGQAVGAPAAGLVTDAAGATTAFYLCATLGLIGALVCPRHRPATRRSTNQRADAGP